jgi:hypothetical protein
VAPFFKLEPEQQQEYVIASRAMTRELDFWAVHNDPFMDEDKTYWLLLARFEKYMDAPSMENNRKLKSMIKSFEEKGADGDWLWEIYDEVVFFVDSKLWPWAIQLWHDIIVQDVEVMEKLLARRPIDFL